MPYPPQVTLVGDRGADNQTPKFNSAFHFSFQGDMKRQVRKIIQKHGVCAEGGIAICGHSLGAGVACICAALLATKGGPKIHVVSAGAPKPGNAAFR